MKDLIQIIILGLAASSIGAVVMRLKHTSWLRTWLRLRCSVCFQYWTGTMLWLLLTPELPFAYTFSVLAVSLISGFWIERYLQTIE